jgi:hypothetical protein
LCYWLVLHHAHESHCRQILRFLHCLVVSHLPWPVGYQPTLATNLGGLQERITTTKKGLLHMYRLFMCLLMI